jgi:hypothetical protein
VIDQICRLLGYLPNAHSGLTAIDFIIHKKSRFSTPGLHLPYRPF